jgi:hypothetical protein
MEPKGKTTWGSPADWVTAIGAMILLVGVVGYLTGLSPEATTPDMQTLIVNTSNATNMMITSGVGLVVLVVGIVMKGRK